MADMMKDQKAVADEHGKQLADGAINFKVIDTKQDYIIKTLDEMRNDLKRNLEEPAMRRDGRK